MKTSDGLLLRRRRLKDLSIIVVKFKNPTTPTSGMPIYQRSIVASCSGTHPFTTNNHHTLIDPHSAADRTSPDDQSKLL